MGDAPRAGDGVLPASHPSIDVPDAPVNHPGHLLDGVARMLLRDRPGLTGVLGLVRALGRTLVLRRDALPDHDNMLRDLRDLVLLADKGLTADPEGGGLFAEHLGHLLDRDVLERHDREAVLVRRLATIGTGGVAGNRRQGVTVACWLSLETHRQALSTLARMRSRRLASASCLISRLGGRLRHREASNSSLDNAKLSLNETYTRFMSLGILGPLTGLPATAVGKLD